MSFYVRPSHVFRKPFLIALRRLDIFGLKRAACKYWDSSGFEVCAIMLFTTFFDCCVPRGAPQIPVFLFLVPLIISSPLLWIEISCLSSVMVHPSSHKTTIILKFVSEFCLPHFLIVVSPGELPT